MLLARLEPWHWWLGIGFTGIAVLTAVALGAGYLKQVVRPQYPGRRRGDID